VLASLNHPNIAQLYGLEEVENRKALVMELVEGSTLADRIATRPLPLAEVVPIAKQIAEALRAAHRRGIIHRDLKPANVKVGSDGDVKILDFGLAKELGPAESTSASISHVVTQVGAPRTVAGGILGTPAYMSPEQAQGRAADSRSDIWAFGVVVYELLTGRRLFESDSVAGTLSAVMDREPDWSGIAPAAEYLLRWCLERDPRRRLQDIGDASRLLDDPLFPPVEKPPAPRTPSPRPSTAADDAAPERIFRVTHPFHPLTGRAFELVAVRQTWGEYRVFYYDEAGALAALPTTWTDVAEPDPFVAIAAGRAYCRVADLLRLAMLVGEGER